MSATLQAGWAQGGVIQSPACSAAQEGPGVTVPQRRTNIFYLGKLKSFQKLIKPGRKPPIFILSSLVRLGFQTYRRSETHH